MSTPVKPDMNSVIQSVRSKKTNIQEKQVLNKSQYTIDLEGDLPSEFNEFRFQFESITSQSGFLDDSENISHVTKNLSKKSFSDHKNQSKKSIQYSHAFVNGKLKSINAKDIVSQKNFSTSNITEFDKVDKSNFQTSMNYQEYQVNNLKLECAIYFFENQMKSKLFTFSNFAYNLGFFISISTLFIILLFNISKLVILLLIVPILFVFIAISFKYVSIKSILKLI
jgi:hypothetical protein